MSNPEQYLIKGPMPELTKMKLKELKEECQMWRNVWGWVPPEVKYYVARVGQDVGLTLRNYKRYLGKLIDSHWMLDSLEIGTVDKVYDSVTDKYFYEKKICVIKTSSILDVQWIKERKSFEEFEEETRKAKELEETQQPTETETNPDAPEQQHTP